MQLILPTSIARTQVDRSGRSRKGTRRRSQSRRTRIASLTLCRRTPTTKSPSSAPSVTVTTRATRNERPRRTSPMPQQTSRRLRADSWRQDSAPTCCSSCRSRCLPRRVPRCVISLSLVLTPHPPDRSAPTSSCATSCASPGRQGSCTESCWLATHARSGLVVVSAWATSCRPTCPKYNSPSLSRAETARYEEREQCLSWGSSLRTRCHSTAGRRAAPTA